MSSKKEELIINYLNLMYPGDTVRHMYSYTSPSSEYMGPISVIFINKEPIIETRMSHKTIIETNFSFNPFKQTYSLHQEFKEKMFSIFGDVPNLTELVVEWVIRKELKGKDIYNYENYNI
jgi:hypothetical protein